MFALPDKYRYPFILAIIAAGILAVGLALKPTPKPTARHVPDVTATRAELESLQRLVQRNSLRNIGTQFSAVAAEVSDYLLPLVDSRQNAVVWSGGELVAKRMGELPHAVQIVAAGEVHLAAPQQWIPGMPFATVQSVATTLAPPSVAATPAEGAWIVATSARADQPPVFRPGIYNGTAAVDCGPFVTRKLVTTVALASELLGGALFDLQSDLLGVVVECEEGLAVISPSEVQRALSAAAASPLLSQYGMAVAAADPAWKQALGADASLVVTDVWRNWPADVAGIHPGDVILSVGGAAVPGLPELVRLLTSPGAQHEIQVRRGRRNLRIALQAVGSTSAAQPAAVDVAAPASGVILQRVLPGSSADRAGLRAGDRIVQVNGTPATPDGVLHAMGQVQVSAPVLVVVERRSRSMAVVLQ